MTIKGNTENQIYVHPHTLMSLLTQLTMQLFTLINMTLLFQKTFVQEDESVHNIYYLFQKLLESIQLLKMNSSNRLNYSTKVASKPCP